MLRNILSCIVIPILSISVYAQNGNSSIQTLFEQGKIDDACVEITKHITDSIIQSQDANSDPYGFAFSLKLSTILETQYQHEFNYATSEQAQKRAKPSST